METGASPYENLDLWWVYVVHTDGKYDYAQVNQFVDWKPKRPGDFKKNEKYTLRTNKFNPNKKYDKCKVFILKVEETMENLEKTVAQKRFSIPRLDPRDSDFLSDSDSGEPGATNSKGIKRILPLTSAEQAAKKKKSEMKDMDHFSSQLHSLLTGPSTSAGATSAVSETHSQPSQVSPKDPSKRSKPSTPTVPSVPPLTKSKTLKPQIPQLSNSTNTSVKATPSKIDTTLNHSTVQVNPHSAQGSANNPNPIISSEKSFSGASTPSSSFYVEEIRKRDEELADLKRQLNESQAALARNVDVILKEIRNVSQRVGTLEESMTNFSNSNSSKTTSGVGYPADYTPTPVTFMSNDEVALGSGVLCKRSAYTSMITTANETMFANSFVLGTLREDAHLYGLFPRNGKLKFEDNFKRVAVAHWTDFLVRNGWSLPIDSKKVKEILAKLSSRCHDAAGRRNTGTGKKRTKPNDSEDDGSSSLFLNPETGELETVDGLPAQQLVDSRSSSPVDGIGEGHLQDGTENGEIEDDGPPDPDSDCESGKESEIETVEEEA